MPHPAKPLPADDNWSPLLHNILLYGTPLVSAALCILISRKLGYKKPQQSIFAGIAGSIPFFFFNHQSQASHHHDDIRKTLLSWKKSASEKNKPDIEKLEGLFLQFLDTQVPGSDTARYAILSIKEFIGTLNELKDNEELHQETLTTTIKLWGQEAKEIATMLNEAYSSATSLNHAN
jgi:hypothetical protein